MATYLEPFQAFAMIRPVGVGGSQDVEDFLLVVQVVLADEGAQNLVALSAGDPQNGLLLVEIRVAIVPADADQEIHSLEAIGLVREQLREIRQPEVIGGQYWTYSAVILELGHFIHRT